MAAVHPRLVLSDGLRTACVVLQVVPLPGVGAVVAGWRNPHTWFRSHGLAQMALVVFGSWPLILPGVAGLAWAIWDAVRIAQWSQAAPAWSEPAPDADPETLEPDRRAQREAARQARARQRAQRRAARAQAKAARQEAAEEDDTRYLP